MVCPRLAGPMPSARSDFIIIIIIIIMIMIMIRIIMIMILIKNIIMIIT